MSDIQEEQKRLYKRAEENDIKLLQEENKKLKKKITFNEKSRRKMQQSLIEQIEIYKSLNKKAIEYIEQIIDFVAEDKREIERDKYILKLLKGDNK